MWRFLPTPCGYRLGNWHDAFLPADFSVKAGATVHVTVYNYDDMPHTFTAAELGVNVEVPAGSGSMERPGKVTFSPARALLRRLLEPAEDDGASPPG